MCLAIPMRVIEISGTLGDGFNPPVAAVEADGIRQNVRLDIVDRMPIAGDYVIVHAGFALNTLDAEQARANLALLEELTAGGDEAR
jgi:hydrogenase expression/formation protein HypC